MVKRIVNQLSINKRNKKSSKVNKINQMINKKIKINKTKPMFSKIKWHKK
jgi:hypothetical protein